MSLNSEFHSFVFLEHRETNDTTMYRKPTSTKTKTLESSRTISYQPYEPGPLLDSSACWLPPLKNQENDISLMG